MSPITLIVRKTWLKVASLATSHPPIQKEMKDLRAGGYYNSIGELINPTRLTLHHEGSSWRRELIFHRRPVIAEKEHSWCISVRFLVRVIDAWY